ncbi:SEC-C motif-containing protein [Frankia torreyi]|uniref:SEC-C motif-containing protein n=2 Tax=Frankia TaxID=1854 RepID=A0A0D8BDX5_9ACTN|nr:MULTISPECIES: DUF5926 family protein [Frankia]KJE22235.1 SEC-C motif-containing protein [Frankia torreyi]KQC40095.1 preprotein translocase subunit SecA [Frankia sp. ACN1ag]
MIARRPAPQRPGTRPSRVAAGSTAARRRSAEPGPDGPIGAIGVVGPREPCPCGSGRRYKACHGERSRPAPVLRPFLGRRDEPDLVALRELVPSATAPVILAADHLAKHPEHADRRITLCTMLPQAAPALVREDGEILVAMQTALPGLDASRDIAGALLAALDAEPGNVVDAPAASSPRLVEQRPDGLAGLPRLTDLLDPAPLEITVHPGFGWWLPPSDDDSGPNQEVAAMLERANATVVPTVRLSAVSAAYWCHPSDRWHLRWALPLAAPAGAATDPAATDPTAADRAATDSADVGDAARSEEALLDALARLAAAERLTVGPGTRFVGFFRADGLVIPVWDLAADTAAERCEEPAAALGLAYREALADPTPLTAQERRVRAGLVGRSLTLR